MYSVTLGPLWVELHLGRWYGGGIRWLAACLAVAGGAGWLAVGCLHGYLSIGCLAAWLFDCLAA